ncbi:GDSL Lipase/Acylhydrolase family protein [Aspergillus udagawae]|nr:GDSL Lipase/Acylhydrolase family protein [Aspergillus udagawae]
MKLAFTLPVLALASTATVGGPLQQRSRELLKKFTSLVVFGDSYTDNGIRSYKPPVAAESAKTSTGGRVWPSYIRQYTGANVYDYARSGAVCDAVIANTIRNGVKQNQIPSFLGDNGYVSNTTGEPALVNPPDETVYAIWIGTNDIGYGGFLTEVQPAGMPLTYLTDCVYAQLDRLYAIGARVFVLMNMAPLDLTPLYALPQNGGSVNAQYWTDKAAYDSNITRPSEKMRQYVTMVNAVYDYQTPYDVVVADRYPHSRFAVYDVHALMTDIWANPSHYLNGTAPYNVASSVYRCGSPCAPNAVRDSYLWYDDLHPSEQTDRIIAREFVNLVKGKSKWAKNWRS